MQPNFILNFLIALALNNIGCAKFCTHRNKQFDNNRYYEIFQKTDTKTVFRLLVNKCQ